jgi:hypothetical protein
MVGKPATHGTPSDPNFWLVMKARGFRSSQRRLGRVLLKVVKRPSHVFQDQFAKIATDSMTYQDSLNR